MRQKQAHKNDLRQTGLTLSELLIALAILGIIAAFTIPKVLEAQGQQEAKAKIRETVAALEQAWYIRKLANQINVGPGDPDNTRLYGNLIPSLNVLAGADTNVPTSILPNSHPCGSPPGFLMPMPGIQYGWLVFPNGVVVTGLGATNMGSGGNGDGTMDNLRWDHPLHNPGSNYILCLDHNGRQGPNTPGIDIYFGNFNQFGAFTGPPLSENAKSFNWGSTVNPGVDHVYGYGPGICCYGSLAGVGDNTRTPPAVVGVLLQD